MIKYQNFYQKQKKEKFDRYGFLASIFIISKNFKKQFKETEILKYNNNKFKEMPLFYVAKAIFEKEPTNITENRWLIGKMRITRCILV